jgi:hypothetical protein
MAEVKHSSTRPWIWHFSWIGLLVVALFGEVWVSKFVFHRLCATEGGEEILQVIDRVEGVLVDYGKNSGCDVRCRELLGTYKYRFVEMRVDAPNKQSLTSVPGNYRFYLTQRHRKECAAYDLAFEGNESFRSMTEKRFDIPHSMCIASIHFLQPTSEYVYRSAWENGYIKVLGISKLESTITERRTGKMLGRKTVFSRRNGHGWLMRLSGLPDTSEMCHDFPGGSLLVKALKPATT